MVALEDRWVETLVVVQRSSPLELR